MTKAEAEDYLRKAERYRSLIRSYVEQIAEINNDLAGIKAIIYDGVKVQSSFEDNTAELYDRLMTLERKFKDVYIEYIDYKEQVNVELSMLRNELHRDILKYRYVENHTLRNKEIADLLGYSEGHIKKEYGNAIVNFANNIKKDTK